MDKQSFCWMAKRPLGVSMRMDGGLYGYCGEKTIFLHQMKSACWSANDEGSWLWHRHGSNAPRAA